MRIAIYSIQSTLFEGEAEKLLCWTPQGQIAVLDNHIPLISTLIGPAVEIMSTGGESNKVGLSGGILEVRPESEVVILAQQYSRI